MCIPPAAYGTPRAAEQRYVNLLRENGRVITDQTPFKVGSYEE